MDENTFNNFGWGSVLVAWLMNILEWFQAMDFNAVTTGVISLLSIIYLGIKIYKELK